MLSLQQCKEMYLSNLTLGGVLVDSEHLIEVQPLTGC